MNQAEAAQRVSFHKVLAIREFRVLYITLTLSVVGDQLARIAIASVIYSRTQSSMLTSLSYALSYLPWLMGGPVLSVCADRYCRRTVMIVCDAARAVLVLLMAAPALPTAVLLCFIAAVGLLQPPFASARAALVPEVVGEGSLYTAASTLANSTNQLGVVLGFAMGGLLTALAGPSITLIADALTFTVSAVAIVTLVSARPPLHLAHKSWSADMREGAAAVFGDAKLRWLVTTSWLVVGAAIVTEGIAVPYAHSHRHGPIAAGVLTAALPAGTFVGALILGRIFGASAAERLMRPLAIATPVILSATAFNPGVTVTCALWFVAGATSAMTVVANRIFVVGVAPAVRSRAFGVAAAGIAACQGLGTLAIGALSNHSTPADAVTMSSLVVLAMLLLLDAWPRLTSRFQPETSRLQRIRGCAPGAQPRVDGPLTPPSRGLPAS